MVVLDEDLLMELALWGWVVFVLWTTRPNHDGEAWQDLHKDG
jgi:hypothetical protein